MAEDKSGTSGAAGALERALSVADFIDRRDALGTAYNAALGAILADLQRINAGLDAAATRADRAARGADPDGVSAALAEFDRYGRELREAKGRAIRLRCDTAAADRKLQSEARDRLATVLDAVWRLIADFQQAVGGTA